MAIYQKIKSDHDKLKSLLQTLVAATEHNADTKKLLEEIEQELVPHARAEEAILYNSLKEESDTAKQLIADSFQEHVQAEGLLRTLKGLSSIGVEWSTAANKLKESLEEHIEKEEGEVFNKAKEIFTDEEARQFGEVFEKAKEEARKQGNLKNMVQMFGNMLPKRFADRIRDSLQSAS